MFSTRYRAIPALGLLLCAISLSSCTGPSPSPTSVGQTSTGPSAGTPSQQPTQGRDGSVLLPTAEIQTCAALSPDRIREILGEAADTIQPAEVAGTIDPSGTRREDCLYPLDQTGATTHAVIFSIATYPDSTVLENSKPWDSLMAPTPVTGFRGETRYSVNKLSESTEFVLQMVEGVKVHRLMVAQPTASVSWSDEEGLSALEELARTAGF